MPKMKIPKLPGELHINTVTDQNFFAFMSSRPLTLLITALCFILFLYILPLVTYVFFSLIIIFYYIVVWRHQPKKLEITPTHLKTTSWNGATKAYSLENYIIYIHPLNMHQGRVLVHILTIFLPSIGWMISFHPNKHLLPSEETIFYKSGFKGTPAYNIKGEPLIFEDHKIDSDSAIVDVFESYSIPKNLYEYIENIQNSVDVELDVYFESRKLFNAYMKQKGKP